VPDSASSIAVPASTSGIFAAIYAIYGATKIVDPKRIIFRTHKQPEFTNCHHQSTVTSGTVFEKNANQVVEVVSDDLPDCS
jgi:hypothetical protein